MLERAVVSHRDPALTPLVKSVAERLADSGLIRGVLQVGEPTLMRGFTHSAEGAFAADPTLRAAPSRHRYPSCLPLPHTVAGRHLAVLTIGASATDPLEPADVELAVDIGRRGASALERAQLWQDHQRRFETEHRIVGQLQSAVIPEQLPELDGLQLAAAYRP